MPPKYKKVGDSLEEVKDITVTSNFFRGELESEKLGLESQITALQSRIAEVDALLIECDKFGVVKI